MDCLKSRIGRYRNREDYSIRLTPRVVKNDPTYYYEKANGLIYLNYHHTRLPQNHKEGQFIKNVEAALGHETMHKVLHKHGLDSLHSEYHWLSFAVEDWIGAWKA